MSLRDAQQEAARRAAAALASVDLGVRCDRLGLPAPLEGALRFRAFGQDLALTLPHFELRLADSDQPARPGDRILVLHYLQYEGRIEPSGELISFRDMPGGQFYWPAFRARSVEPLLRRVGNQVDTLATNLRRYDWQPFDRGDLGARIHGIGRVEVYLIYYRGDEQFGPSADMLFDASIKRVYPGEDVAYLAGRICLGLL